MRIGKVFFPTQKRNGEVFIIRFDDRSLAICFVRYDHTDENFGKGGSFWGREGGNQ